MRHDAGSSPLNNHLRRIFICSCSRYCLLCEFIFQTEEQVNASPSRDPRVKVASQSSSRQEIQHRVTSSRRLKISFSSNYLDDRNELNCARRQRSSPHLSTSPHRMCHSSRSVLGPFWEPQASAYRHVAACSSIFKFGATDPGATRTCIAPTASTRWRHGKSTSFVYHLHVATSIGLELGEFPSGAADMC